LNLKEEGGSLQKEKYFFSTPGKSFALIQSHETETLITCDSHLKRHFKKYLT